VGSKQGLLGHLMSAASSQGEGYDGVVVKEEAAEACLRWSQGIPYVMRRNELKVLGTFGGPACCEFELGSLHLPRQGLHEGGVCCKLLVSACKSRPPE
jgi:hypothetical protein